MPAPYSGRAPLAEDPQHHAAQAAFDAAVLGAMKEAIALVTALIQEPIAVTQQYDGDGEEFYTVIRLGDTEITPNFLTIGSHVKDAIYGRLVGGASPAAVNYRMTLLASALDFMRDNNELSGQPVSFAPAIMPAPKSTFTVPTMPLETMR